MLVPQFCLTLCDPLDCSPPDSFIHGILQGRMLVCVASFHLQGTFLTHGSNPGLLNWQADSLLSEQPGKPIMEFRRHQL